ncbi:MAG: TetR family transcriptional regulator [Frankiales bacterium]|nr:TetR family transcriptional regulator [Frankiales bacterium]
MTTAPRRRGPVPRFSRDQLVDAALAVVDEQGFAALSLRSVARHLGVGPMTLYTYVDSSEELAALVVDRLVNDAVRDLRWPRTWRGVLKLLARKLDALVVEHPSMVEAYGRGMVGGNQIADQVITRLTADGMDPTRAREAYVAVHALVLGFALIRGGRAGAPDRPGPEVASGVLSRLVDTLLDGFET